MLEDLPNLLNVVVRISPDTETSAGDDSPERKHRPYLVFLYSTLRPGQVPRTGAARQWDPQFVLRLPLTSVEHMDLDPDITASLLPGYLQGTVDPATLGRALLRAIPSSVRSLIDEKTTAGPVRIWWETDATELVDLPWELAFHASGPGGQSSRAHLVRGAPPPEEQPVLPVTGPLRIAVLATPATPPRVLEDAFAPDTAGLKVTWLEGSPLEALRQVAREGIEVLHICADAFISPGLESVLYFPWAESPELPLSLVSTTLLGSRVNVISLTYAPRPGELVGGAGLPLAYQAFAWIGSSPLALPTVVTLLGPMEPELEEASWADLYRDLVQSLDIEHATEQARQATSWSSYALFLRNTHGRLFLRRDDPFEFEEPAALDAELAISKELTSVLERYRESIGGLKGVPDDVLGDLEGVMQEQGARQAALTERLQRWKSPGSIE